MHHAQLRDALRKSPFVPFRLHMSSGVTYDVASPEWMMVTNTYSAVGVPGRAGDGDIISLLDNWHVTHIEPLSATPQHERNESA